MPDEVVVRCGLAAGLELDRSLLRRLGSELRRAQALALAGRALTRRDISRQRLAERLERAGVSPVAEGQALDALAAAGAIDDTRLARARAASLAERGWGDSSIAARLEGEGIPESETRAGIELLPPETERAARAVAGLRDRRSMWAFLARRGFDLETIDVVVGPLDEGEGGGLG